MLKKFAIREDPRHLTYCSEHWPRNKKTQTQNTGSTTYFPWLLGKPLKCFGIHVKNKSYFAQSTSCIVRITQGAEC